MQWSVAQIIGQLQPVLNAAGHHEQNAKDDDEEDDNDNDDNSDNKNDSFNDMVERKDFSASIRLSCTSYQIGNLGR